MYHQGVFSLHAETVHVKVQSIRLSSFIYLSFFGRLLKPQSNPFLFYNKEVIEWEIMLKTCRFFDDEFY